MQRVAVSLSLIALFLFGLGGCTPEQVAGKELPKESYEHPAEEPHSKSDLVFKLKQMPSFYDVPGEFGHLFEGQAYGLESLSVILTETQPCGGPPLHTHDTEEAHVLFEGKIAYVIGDKQFTAEGPYIARVPAGVPHTFVNTGAEEFRLVGVLPDKKLSYHPIASNPLVATCRHH